MQRITVEEIRVVTSKPGAEKKWELVALVADGTEFTTFDLAIKEVGIGGVVEFEPVFKDGKINIKKGWTIISKGQAPAPSSTFNGGDSLEKRKSIEDQTRAQRITELWIAGMIARDDNLVTKLRTWLNQLGSPMKAEPVKAEPATSAPKEQPKTETKTPETFKNVGEFLTSMKQKGLSRTEVVNELIRLKMITDEADLPKLNLDEAWEALGDAIIPAQ